jgi:hypothetical protein
MKNATLHSESFILDIEQIKKGILEEMTKKTAETTTHQDDIIERLKKIELLTTETEIPEYDLYGSPILKTLLGIASGETNEILE